ncbi:MAG: cell division protein FtsZ, partial [Candidatus Fonsibacter ubiquis]
RLKAAERGLEELKKYVDTSIIIPNQNLFKVANEKTTFPQAFKMADNVLMQGVRGVTDLIVKPGLINLDFADIETVMKGMGKAMMGTGEAEGDKRAVMSAEAALSNPLIDDYSLKGAKGLLINITGGNDITLFEVDEAANKIRAEVDPSAEILVGSTFEESLGGKMRVSIVATGLGGEAAINNKPVVSMMRHINNRNNGYSTIYNRPNQSFVPNYVTQSAPQAMTNGATALDMFQETSHVNEVNNQTLNHLSVQEEVVNSNLSQEQKISAENLSVLSQKENTQIVEEVASFPKLFSEDESLKDISNNKEGSSQFFKDLGHDLTDEEKVDLEIPAFLRRQTN